MQGRRSSTFPLPDSFFFDDESMAGEEPIADSQLPWNCPRTTEQTLPGSFQNGQQSMQGGHGNLGFSLGESSSSIAARNGTNRSVERNPWEEMLNFSSDAAFSFENRQQIEAGGANTDRRFLYQAPLNCDLNESSLVEEDDDFQVIEPTHAFMGSSSNPHESQLATRKRKAREMHAGQSSSAEGSSSFQLHATSSSLPRQQQQNGITIGNNGSEPSRSRMRIASSTPLSLSPPGNADGTAANRRPWANGSTQQSVRPANNPVLGLNPSTAMENGGNVRQRGSSSYCFAALRRSHLPSSSRYIPSSLFPEQSDAISSEESAARDVSRPVFLPTREVLNPNQNPARTNWAGGNSVAGSGIHGQSSSQAGQSRGTRSEIARRTPLPPIGLESGGSQAAQNGPRSIQPGLAGLGQRARSALLGRRLNAAIGLSHSLRAFSAGDEGRSPALPEHIRRVLDVMRRDGLRFEDMLINDHSSPFFAMGDVNDRHRDMRMDVDNMSYEELLALGERIGEVCTGLSEESITEHMKVRKYSGDGNEAEPCSICREEYNEGEDVGKLECGHDFHRDCIKQWLTQKNLCPICKTTGLNS